MRHRLRTTCRDECGRTQCQEPGAGAVGDLPQERLRPLPGMCRWLFKKISRDRYFRSRQMKVMKGRGRVRGFYQMGRLLWYL